MRAFRTLRLLHQRHCELHQRHCERSEAIHSNKAKKEWIASSFALRATADAVVASAPRNDGAGVSIQFQTADLYSHSRGATLRSTHPTRHANITSRDGKPTQADVMSMTATLCAGFLQP
jgi:hypothetical protein